MTDLESKHLAELVAELRDAGYMVHKIPECTVKAMVTVNTEYLPELQCVKVKSQFHMAM